MIDHPGAPPSVEGIRWPVLLEGRETYERALLYQLEQSEWWPPEILRAHQLRQLDQLVDHAIRHLPFYRRRLAPSGIDSPGGLGRAAWSRVPVLTAAELRIFSRALVCAPPPGHGPARTLSVVCAAGIVMEMETTALCDFFSQIFALRDRAWQRRDASLPLAIITGEGWSAAPPLPGSRRFPWGDEGERGAAGPVDRLDVCTTIDEQVAWLARSKPAYLLAPCALLAAEADYCLEHRIELPGLLQVMAAGEPVTAYVRERCREAWGVEVKEIHYLAEAGYLALQCPRGEGLHVLSEAAFVEVLDEDNRPCPEEESGRLVVTPLHNFATPLIRYDTGERARIRPQCDCGRGLPVIERAPCAPTVPIRLPDGRWVVPFVNGLARDLEMVERLEVVRTRAEGVEVQMVATRTLTASEAERLVAGVRARLCHPFSVTITYVDSFPGTDDVHRDCFRSEVDRAGC